MLAPLSCMTLTFRPNIARFWKSPHWRLRAVLHNESLPEHWITISSPCRVYITTRRPAISRPRPSLCLGLIQYSVGRGSSCWTARDSSRTVHGSCCGHKWTDRQHKWTVQQLDWIVLGSSWKAPARGSSCGSCPDAVLPLVTAPAAVQLAAAARLSRRRSASRSED